MPQRIQTMQPESGLLDYNSEWSNGLCDCCSDCGELVLTICCPIYQEFKVFTNAREFGCTPFLLLNPYISLAHLRAKLRATYKINGSVNGDSCVTGCCPVCSIIQMSRELNAQGESKILK